MSPDDSDWLDSKTPENRATIAMWFALGLTVEGRCARAGTVVLSDNGGLREGWKRALLANRIENEAWKDGRFRLKPQ